MKETYLELRNIDVGFGKKKKERERILHDVSFRIQSGEKIAIVGETGSGKTTLALTILHILPDGVSVENGNILFKGCDITSLKKKEYADIRGNGIGLVSQDPLSSLNPVYKIGFQLREAFEANTDLTREEIRERSIDLLQELGITDPAQCLESYPHELSGGMCQRVLIAITLAGDPDIIIADEMTSALDVITQKKICDYFDSSFMNENKAIVYITHDIALALERADRIFVMNNGAIVESGTPFELFDHPCHEYTQKLLSASFVVKDAKKKSSQPSLTVSRRKHENVALEEPLMEVRGVSKVFEKKRKKNFYAVKDVSFSLSTGSTLTIVGESGSGKTTLAHMLLGLIKPSEGEIFYKGSELSSYSRKEYKKIRQRIQPVFQNPFGSLDSMMSVYRSINEPLKGQVFSRGDVNRRMSDLLDMLSLPKNVVNKYPHELSGGMCQRVAIARALIGQPDILILDEPVSSLDCLVQEQIIDYLQSIQKELGVSYVFITHDIYLASAVGDDVLVMHKGQTVEQGNVDDVFHRPQQPYTRELLEALPRIDSLLKM
ncbi:MAG: ABC transporter ATP-binding protein [Actinomycetaceae bacterium]|nr:ABC transporter ATP-binding protein [Actinomycetaceae bacterium]